MGKNTETGHAKNVSNFGALLSYCNGYGDGFNPANSVITLNALSLMHNDSQRVVGAVNVALSAFNNAVAARETAFKPFSKLVTRVINALKASGATAVNVRQAKSIVRKLQGGRASAKLTEEEKKTLADQGKELTEISASQLSFDNRLENFDKFIDFLSTIPAYNPNEEELKVSTLSALLEDLRAKNKAVIDATAPLSNARIARNNTLYKESSGLVDAALNVKSYVKSVFGAKSPQYRQISGIVFKKYKG